MSIPLVDSMISFDYNLLDLRLQTNIVFQDLLCQVSCQSLFIANTQGFYWCFLFFFFYKDSQVAHSCCRFGSAVTSWMSCSCARFSPALARASSKVFCTSAAWIMEENTLKKTHIYIYFLIFNVHIFFQNGLYINVLVSIVLLQLKFWSTHVQHDPNCKFHCAQSIKNTPAVRPPHWHFHLQVVNFFLRCEALISDSWGLRKRKGWSGWTSCEAQFNTFTWMIPFILVHFGGVQQANDCTVFLKLIHSTFRKKWLSLQIFIYF